MLLLFLCAGRSVYAQCPPNIDFETGSFANWQCSIGSVGSTAGVNVMTLAPSPPIHNRHAITSGTDLDYYGEFPVVCPYGGGYSVKLGNDSIGRQAEGISYTFTVPPTQDTFTFTYFYAVVFQDPNHDPFEQPRFFATAYDVATGRSISCASYDYVATSGIPGFEQSNTVNNVLFKRWSPVSIQFAGLAGHTVRLEFKTADCTRGGHFGYAYVDVSAGCSGILAQAPYCVESNSLILNAPHGFQTYTWYNSDYSVRLGTGQSVTLSPPPVTTGVFHVDMEPFPGFGCRDTADAMVVQMAVPDTPVAESYYEYCLNTAAQPLTATALPNHGLLWYTTPTGGIPTDVPPAVSTATVGTFEYYVSQKTLLGCESQRKKITVTITTPPPASFLIDNPAQCITGNQFNLTATGTGFVNPSYEWLFGDATLENSPNTTTSHSYFNAGSFNIRLRITDERNCVSQMTLPVTVHPKPVAAFDPPPVICQNETVAAFSDRSTVPGATGTVTGWWWSFNGATTTLQSPASFIVTTDGPFPVRMAVTSSQGCFSDTTESYITIYHRPMAAFTMSDHLCENEITKFIDRSTIPSASADEVINHWDWQLGPTATSSTANPQHLYPSGAQHARLVVTSNHTCTSPPLDSVFLVHAKPAIAIQMNDSCSNAPVRFTAVDPAGVVNVWRWDFGSGFRGGGSQVARIFTRADHGTAILSGETVFGCRDTVSRSYIIYDNVASAGRDTSGPLNEPIQLNAHGGSNMHYLWSPPDGLSSPTIENPVATLNRDQTYNLYAINDQGCIRRSKIHIMRYKGPDIYVPTAFSPNGDGVNDEFLAVPYGITQFAFLVVYDRYGNEVFNTRDARRGWDGKYKSADAPTGAYVFMAKGTDFKGREIFKKGTVVLIR